MPLKILTQEKRRQTSGAKFQQWTQTFWNWTFLDVQRTNKSTDSVVVNKFGDLH